MKIPLLGLNGENPLAFLASVGTLRILSEAWPEGHVRITWENATSWKPVLVAEQGYTAEDVITTLSNAIEGRKDSPEFNGLGEDLPVLSNAFVELARLEIDQASHRRRTTVDFLAAFGSNVGEDDELIQETDFRTMSGAGHQHFLGSMREIAEGTAAKHVRSALFETWAYADPRPSMRWDPLDDRRYALRASDPGNSNQSPIQTVRGANWLAIEAMTFFPTIPTEGGVRTKTFFGTGRSTTFCWPLWQVPITAEALRSLLGHQELISENPQRAILQPLGVCEVFHSRRLTVGRFRTFTIGAPCWGSGVESSRVLRTI